MDYDLGLNACPEMGRRIRRRSASRMLANQTVRQVARISVGGNKLRIVLSNEYGRKPLIDRRRQYRAGRQERCSRSGSLKKLTWGGRPFAVAPPGAPIVSDPVELKVEPLSEVAVSIFLPDRTALSSVHWDGAQTAYCLRTRRLCDGRNLQGRQHAHQTPVSQRNPGRRRARNRAPWCSSVTSITDGACSTVDANNRWPDHVAERLQKAGHKDVAVVNHAYSGNRVLSDGMGTNALARLDDHILSSRI